MCLWLSASRVLSVVVVSSLAELCAAAQEVVLHSTIALDCEGVNLDRHGVLCTLQIGLPPVSVSPNEISALPLSPFSEPASCNKPTFIDPDDNDTPADTAGGLALSRAITGDITGKSTREGVPSSGDVPDHAVALYKVYVMDCLALGSSAFRESGLVAYLEDARTTKLLFDCRRDLDALQHQLHIAVRGVCDIQLLELASSQSAQAPSAPTTRPLLPGLSKTLAKHMPELLSPLKAHVKETYSEQPALWQRRPLSRELLEYSACDVALLHVLFDEVFTRVLGQHSLARLRAYSDSKHWAGSIRDRAMATPRSELQSVPSVYELLFSTIATSNPDDNERNNKRRKRKAR